jgi:hypothetical protein
MTQKLDQKFIDTVNARLQKGAETYGDLAFKKRTTVASLQEVKDELLDVVGWSALTIRKIDSLIEAAEALPGSVDKEQLVSDLERILELAQMDQDKSFEEYTKDLKAVDRAIQALNALGIEVST